MPVPAAPAHGGLLTKEKVPVCPIATPKPKKGIAFRLRASGSLLARAWQGFFIPPLASECVEKRSRRHPTTIECLLSRASGAMNAPGTEGYGITQNSTSRAIEFGKRPFNGHHGDSSPKKFPCASRVPRDYLIYFQGS
jgi:hypothetical protein